MKTIVSVGLVLAASLASAGQAQAQVSTVQSLLDQMIAITSGQGYQRDVSTFGSQIIGALDDDGVVQIQVTLRAGTRYAIGGVCDSDCSDLDLSVTSGTTVVGSDVLSDDTPIVTFTAQNTGPYMVKITMATCSANPCSFGLMVFSK
ncbi:MAG TPA: hypothetical protein VMY38_08010 [Gemmatimonadaceae bacterium]|nr:hypothetical protein [Gemmatimonadaceae bacterium]